MTLWLAAFLLTVGVELAVLAIILPRARPALVVAAQLATHPALYLVASFGPGPWTAKVVVLELAATLVEAALYRRALALPATDAFAASALANAASLGASAAIVALT